MQLISEWREYAQRERLQPDVARAVRCIFAFMGPLLAAHFWKLPIEPLFAAIAGQNIAMMDVRGAYPVRLSLFGGALIALAGFGWLGTLVGDSLIGSLVGVLLLMLATGISRHLSAEYGPSVAMCAALLFLIALAHPGGSPAAYSHLVSAAVGGAWGIVIQVCTWPFRAEHPRRRDVADSWLAVSELVAGMDEQEGESSGERELRLIERQGALRTALDHATATLALVPRRHQERFRTLGNLNVLAARLATRIVVLNHSLDALRDHLRSASLSPLLSPVLASLANTSRALALTLVSRQPAHFATFEVRLRRVENLVTSLEDRVSTQTAGSPDSVQLTFILGQLLSVLRESAEELRVTVDRKHEQGAFSFELLDLQTWSLRPLASALNLTWRVNPTLLRFLARATVLQLLGVGLFQFFHLERGYWLPLTMFVVLQPEYGATRQRAAQRTLGTLAGSVVASGLLFLPLPPTLSLVAMTLTIAGFAFWIRRNYAIAVFFITLFVVLMTETFAPVTLAFTVERLAATAAGGVMAMLAAFLFWPVWERDQFPRYLQAALLGNRDYLKTLFVRLREGGSYDAGLIEAKRSVELANSQVFTSLQRMAVDPKHQQRHPEQAAALANGNQRLTRALTAIALTLSSGNERKDSFLFRFESLATDVLETLAEGAVGHLPPSGWGARLANVRSQLNQIALPSREPATTSSDHALVSELARSVAELSAMVLAAEKSLGETESPAVKNDLTLQPSP